MFDIFYSGKKPNLFEHEREARDLQHAQTLSCTRYFWWVSYLCDYNEFDWTFEPKPWQSQYTHVWPSQHHQYSGTYLVPKSGDIQYHFKDTVVPTTDRPDEFVFLTKFVDFDCTWIPHPHDPPYIYVFGNQWWPAEQWPTVTYTVPGATERKYMDQPRARLLPDTAGWSSRCDRQFNIDCSWRPDPGDPPYHYVFGNQWHSAEKMPTVQWSHPDADQYTAIKYVDWPRAELLPDTTRWTVPADVDAATIDFSWVPDPGEPPYIYQFATQHQKTGGPIYTVPGATEIKYLEHIEVRVEAGSVPIVEIDHLDGNAGCIPNTVKRVRYFDNYRDTLIRIAKSLKGQHEWAWICSSICNYDNFDFTWHPERWQSTMLHVFASDNQKFGDTFYMHVPSFAERAEKKQLLEWYAVNFVPGIRVPRRPMPVIVHDQDSHVAVVQQSDFAGPLATFTNHDYVTGDLVTVPLWRAETKSIVPVSSGAGTVVVPKTAVPFIKTQLYDYPHIDKTQRRLLDPALDIVFVSNGEPCADQNYQQLLISCRAGNRVHRVDGVTGRVAAYHAAAQTSTTPWFFAVFAKLWIANDFDWSWQPDRMQQPKHYIFHARNPVNGLEYGHQAMIAYNRELVLTNSGVGLDFTLDSAHEVVPIFSGVALYNWSAWMAWRTAFREVIKLKASLPDVENEYRINRWCASGEGHNAEWSAMGAQDALEYYDSVKGDITELRRSYEWSWLASYVFVKRGLVP